MNQRRSMCARGTIILWVVSDDFVENIVVSSQWGRQGVLIAGVLVGADCVYRVRGCIDDGTRITDLLVLRGGKVSTKPS